jgi:hypothetical protein
MASSARDRIDETVNRIRSVRDERYRYIRGRRTPSLEHWSYRRFR